ncbi:hypothetical protein FWH09_02810, partial [Candidatus Saccharibacteria bacterium]|nr:hypothetical protein [Candidatus Saccharibacteria bacterium]
FISEKLLSFHIFIMRWFEELTFLHYEIEISALLATLSYAAIILIIIFLKHKTKLRFREVDLLDFTPYKNPQTAKLPR